MRTTHFLTATLLTVVSLAACRCDDTAQRVVPYATVAPLSLDFGKVKPGVTSDAQQLSITSDSQAGLQVSAVTVRDGSAPGGAAAFTLENVPTSVSPLGTATVNVRFTPSAVLGYEAILEVKTNDPERPTIEVLLTGEGASPVLAVLPECDAADKCKGTVVVSPPSIDFGAEPLMRLVPVNTLELPSVTLVNEGPVELAITSPGGASTFVIEGRDAAAFALVESAQLPGQLADGTPAMLLAPGAGTNFHLRFTPTTEAQTVYDQASLVLLSDDPAKPEVRVPLRGTLRPNEPPRVCANITRVAPGEGPPTDYNRAQDWAPLLTPPAGGYDFTATRDIQPSSSAGTTVLSFSAWSDDDVRNCTTDPEDARVMLTYQWEILKAPSGAGPVAFNPANGPRPTLSLPRASGTYEARLTVRDVQGHATQVNLTFAAVLKQDLVAQLSWVGYSRVDLDLHLVRPSSGTGGTFNGVFSWFDEPGGRLADGGVTDQKTSGDINGLSSTQVRIKSPVGANFDWGVNGTFDDPRQYIDETGNGQQLVESISLNYPENDVACSTADCRYKILVHYFRDDRAASVGTCSVSGGCGDGERCNCTGDEGVRCVADSAPASTAPSGNGTCHQAPEPVIRVFVKGNPVPAAVVPLDTLMPPNRVFLGAPCQMLYVADVVWPAKSSLDGGVAPDGGTGVWIDVKGATADRVTAPVISRFGQRNQGSSLSCVGNLVQGGTGWYQQAP